jgi:hypothetical protein
LQPGSLLWSLESAVYHTYSLQAYLNFATPDNTLLGASYYLNTSDTTGTGEIVQASFTPGDPPGDPPPAGVPEPSSVVMMGIGILSIYFVRSRRCVTSITCS